jgi:hypothetical protein
MASMPSSEPEYKLYCAGAFESAAYTAFPYIAAPILVASTDGSVFVKVNYELRGHGSGLAAWELTRQIGPVEQLSIRRARYVACEPIPYDQSQSVIVTSSETLVLFDMSQRIAELAATLLKEPCGRRHVFRTIRLLFDITRSRLNASMARKQTLRLHSPRPDGEASRH